MKKNQIEQIIEKLNFSEKKSSSRTIGEEAVRKILEALKRKPFFSLKMDGGGVANSYKYKADSTHLNVQYDRETDYFKFGCMRTYAAKVPYGRGPKKEINTETRSLCVSPETREKMKQAVVEKLQPLFPNYKLEVHDDLTVKYQLVVEHAGEEYHFQTKDKPYAEKNLLKKIEEGKWKIKERQALDKKRAEKEFPDKVEEA